MSKTRFLEQSPYCKILCLDWFSPQLVQIIKVFLTKHIFKEVLHIPHMKQSISFKADTENFVVTRLSLPLLIFLILTPFLQHILQQAPF